LADILLLQADQRAQATLTRALQTRYRCEQIEHFLHIEALVSQAGPRGCVLDVFHPLSPVPLSTLRNFRRRHPSIALIVAADFTGREMELYHLGKGGIGGIIRLEEDPPSREILKVVDRALASSLAEVVILTVARDLPPLAQEAIRWTIEKAEARPRVEDLASGLGLTPGTFRRELRALDLAPPRSLLLWGRLIQATYLLERPYETVENVAYRLGYATGGALRKALKRHVKCSPTTLLRRGGLAWTLEAFQKSGLQWTASAEPN
jgi:AraC-like DNA-binding protein